MREDDRSFFETTTGAAVMGLGAVAVLVVLVVLIVRSISADDPTTSRVFMDAGVNPPQMFRATIGPGMAVPIKAPSGKNAGYPAETCFWTRDGKTKTEPTYVLVNQLAGRPGPTFCPDCGRLVTMHNAAPDGTRPAPPTEAEFRARKLDALSALTTPSR